MSEIVHITFEKLTGLKGTFEGVFVCDEELDVQAPLVFNAFMVHNSDFVFTQNGKYVYMKPLESMFILNYIEHFLSGVNFNIAKWSYGRGAGYNKSISNSPN